MPSLGPARQRWIRVEVSRVAMLRYAREREFVVDWRIIFEGSG
ncbi:MAG TPA: hypothetical protein VHI32_00195 [Burkholderiales bacterium]|nr:hypothetical protein [Burkholderiales bacterium]